MSSLNKVILIGNVGNDPDVRTMQSGDKVINFSLATSESWKNSSGERQTKTEWHNVVVFNKGLISVIENYVSKGSKIYIEGQIETRSWEDQSGVKKYTTEVVMRPFRSELVMLDSKKNDAPSDIFAPAGNNFDDTEIPF
jgi:single-strand DNA-binding protein